TGPCCSARRSSALTLSGVELAGLDDAVDDPAVGVVVGADDTGEHGDREAEVPDHDDAGEAGGEAPAYRVPARVVQAEALEHRPGPVEEVEAQGDVGDDVDERYHRPLEAGHDVAVDVAPHEVGVGRAPGEVGQVPEHEEQDDDAGHPHRAAGDGG